MWRLLFSLHSLEVGTVITSLVLATSQSCFLFYIDCGEPALVTDTVMYMEPETVDENGNQSTVYGSVAVYQCLPGYEMFDQNASVQQNIRISCSENGTWDPLPKCQRKG